MRLNPMSYIVDGARRSFYAELPAGTTVATDATIDLLVVVAFTLFSLSWATLMTNRSK
jgi:ABC-type polysaccharide/polyol phosphate export permease